MSKSCETENHNRKRESKRNPALLVNKKKVEVKSITTQVKKVKSSQEVSSQEFRSLWKGLLQTLFIQTHLLGIIEV